VELVVLDIGSDLGLISPAQFTMMVVMALVTTFLTSPLLRMTRNTSTRRAHEERMIFT
jgi:Kef-type K+ transport system membrane component KefB